MNKMCSMVSVACIFKKGSPCLYLMVNAYDVSERMHNKHLMAVSFGERVRNEGRKENFHCYISSKDVKLLT